MRKVNTEEIKCIEDFIIKKDIVYYDLQIELLDHICSGIEEQWKKDPDLNFKKAFHNEYKHFGIYGFSDILEKREANLKKHYWKKIGQHSINWFKIPQLFFTLLLVYSIFHMLSSSYNFIFMDIIIVGICAATITKLITLSTKLNRKKKKKEKILLIDHVIKEASAFSFIIYGPLIQNYFLTEEKALSTVASIILSIIFTLLILLTYMIVYDFPKNKKTYFKHNYSIAQ